VLTGQIDAGTRIGAVGLVVASLTRSMEYYQQRIGLAVLSQDAGGAVLGVDGHEMLVLTEQPGAMRFPSGHAGLYHFALLTPTRAALGRSLQRLLDTRTELSGASDHGVSEALYLSDPDGHGIEIYRDRPRPEWPMRDGELAMTGDPFDARGVLASGEGQAWAGMESGTTMGHIHLHVADLAESEHFYLRLLGFDLMQRWQNADFVAAGGYHHHIGMNLWAGKGAPPAPPEYARMQWYEILLPSQGALDSVLARLETASWPAEPHARGTLVRDPAHNGVVLRVAA
jgi:catechol 2,3-dioxygenase